MIHGKNMKYILSLDQGTTSSRALIINKMGQKMGSASKKFKQIFPRPALVEHDPIEIYESQIESVKNALKDASLTASQIAGIGITNQRETIVVWDKRTGRPLMNAIVWQDRRTADMCKSLKDKEDIFRGKTGLLLDPYFSGTKLSWILDNHPGSRENENLICGTIDSWLIWNLTEGKVHITDMSNAARTLLFNIHTETWDDELLEIFNIPKRMLPLVKSSSEIYGETSLFGSPIPISGIAGDQSAALFAQGCYEKGDVKITYGTGCFMLMQLGEKPLLSKNGLLTSIAWKVKGMTQYALEGSVFNAGTVIQWLISMGIITSPKEADELASSVSSTDGVYFIPAFTGLGAPHWDPSARGMVLGITRGTEKAHLIRSGIEGVGFQTMDLFHAMKEDTGLNPKSVRVDGGLSRSELLLQFQSDLIETDIEKPTMQETTAYGAAFLAGLGIGYWESLDEIKQLWKLEKSFSPIMEKKELLRQKTNWQKAINCNQHAEEIEL